MQFCDARAKKIPSKFATASSNGHHRSLAEEKATNLFIWWLMNLLRTHMFGLQVSLGIIDLMFHEIGSN